MDPDFQSRLNAMIAASDGKIWIVSGDRDTATQTRLWNEAVKKYGPEEARNWVAPPGRSNHEKGIAADLGGDLELAAQLAPKFGLYRPMSWELWHFEPLGSRDKAHPHAYTEKPVDPSALVSTTNPRDYGDVMREVLGIKGYESPASTADISLQRGGSDPIVAGNPGFLTPELLGILGPLQPGPNVAVPGTGVNDSFANQPLSFGNPGLDRFMAALRDVESSGNYRVVGVPTPWGTAKGAYQYLDSTWDNYKGYASADQAPPEIQDEKARMDMQRYYDKYGSWDDVAAAWYSGPGGNWQSGEVREYVGKVNSRL